MWIEALGQCFGVCIHFTLFVLQASGHAAADAEEVQRQLAEAQQTIEQLRQELVTAQEMAAEAAATKEMQVSGQCIVFMFGMVHFRPTQMI